MLYDETERVKSFHSSLLLSDALSEREAQTRARVSARGAFYARSTKRSS